MFKAVHPGLPMLLVASPCQTNISDLSPAAGFAGLFKGLLDSRMLFAVVLGLLLYFFQQVHALAHLHVNTVHVFCLLLNWTLLNIGRAFFLHSQQQKFISKEIQGKV